MSAEKIDKVMDIFHEALAKLDSKEQKTGVPERNRNKIYNIKPGQTSLDKKIISGK